MRKMILMVVCWSLIWGVSTPGIAQESTASDKAQHPHTGGAQSIEDRIERLEQTIDRPVESDRWYDRIQLSGLIEVEAGYGQIDFDDPDQEDETTSDIDLAAVELGVDAKIAAHVDGHVLLKYEADEVFVDEGFITLTGPDAFPAYLIAGRQYIPFGNYDSHFITDPNTLVLGETNEGAVVAGYRIGGETVEIVVGAFNGQAQENDTDDTIDNWVAGIVAQPIEALTLGLSYTSNLAASDAFSEVCVDAENLDALVDGWSAFVQFRFLERFSLMAEYLGALDAFKAGEIFDPADTTARQPSAWNVEFAAALTDQLELAARFGGAEDGGADFLPESQYGIAVNWGFLKNTNLALECLRSEYEADAQVDSLTAQLAVEF